MWNGADGLGTIKDLLHFTQGCGNTRDNIAREQETEIEDEVVDPKDGKTESESINEMHASRSGD